MAEAHTRAEATLATRSSNVRRYSVAERSGKGERDRFAMRKSEVVRSSKISRSPLGSGRASNWSPWHQVRRTRHLHRRSSDVPVRGMQSRSHPPRSARDRRSARRGRPRSPSDRTFRFQRRPTAESNPSLEARPALPACATRGEGTACKGGPCPSALRHVRLRDHRRFVDGPRTQRCPRTRGRRRRRRGYGSLDPPRRWCRWRDSWQGGGWWSPAPAPRRRRTPHPRLPVRTGK